MAFLPIYISVSVGEPGTPGARTITGEWVDGKPCNVNGTHGPWPVDYGDIVVDLNISQTQRNGEYRKIHGGYVAGANGPTFECGGSEAKAEVASAPVEKE